MIRSLKLFKNALIVNMDSKIKTIFVNTTNLLFFISLCLVLTIGRIYPLHYIANVSFLLMCFSMILYVFLYGNFYLDEFVILILVFNLFYLLSTVMNGFEGETYSLMILTIGMLPTYFYFRLAKESTGIIIYLSLFAYLIFNIFFFAMYANEFLSFNFSSRLGTKIANQNDIATFLLTAHCLYLFYIITRKKFYFIPFAILNLIEMVSTGSRSGLLNIIIMTLFLFYLFFRKLGKIRFILVLISIIVFSYFILKLPGFESLYLRFKNLFVELFSNRKADNSTSKRLDLLFQSITVFFRNPIFGAGLNFASKYTFDGNVAHNAYVELAGSHGVFALLTIVILYYSVLKNTREKYIIITWVVITNFLLFYLTLSGLNYKPPYYILPLIASLGKQKKITTTKIIAFKNELLKKC